MHFKHEERRLMIPAHIQSLIISDESIPSIVILQPSDNAPQENKQRVVPIKIGINEATQIGLALEKSKLPRPLTHELFINALSSFGARVDHILIRDVKKSTFLATITIKQENRIINLDARPSDSIALAIRQKAPIFLTQKVIDKASYPFASNNEFDEQTIKKEVTQFRQFLNNINPDDFSNK